MTNRDNSKPTPAFLQQSFQQPLHKLNRWRVSGDILRAVVLGCVVLAFNPVAQAASTDNGGQSRLAVAYVQGEGDVQGVKLAVQQEVPLLSALLARQQFNGTISFELSANFWRYGPQNQTDHNLVLAMSPVLTVPFFRLGSNELSLEFGIGVSLLNDTRFAGKDVSTHYQFEDRLGLIMQLSATDAVNLRYLHYSNAGFKKPNPGLDFIALGYSKAF